MRLHRGRVLSFAASVLFVATAASSRPLPAEVVPDQYELRFAFDLQHDAFTASEQILVNIVKPTARITLNAAGLTVRQVTIVSGWSSQPATVSFDERHDTVTFTVRRPLVAGPARLRVEYSGGSAPSRAACSPARRTAGNGPPASSRQPTPAAPFHASTNRT